MLLHLNVTNTKVRALIRQKQICMTGNRKLNIFGLLRCRSGKRMKRENRVFFVSEQEAWQTGYRPCAHCLPTAYKKWKDGLI